MEARKAAILVLAAIVAGGCMHAPTLSGVRYDIEREIDCARFETEREMTLGRLSLALTRRSAPGPAGSRRSQHERGRSNSQE